LNSLEVVDREGGDYAYIHVRDNEENRQKLRSVGITDAQIDEFAEEGIFDILALAMANDWADDYDNGKFILYGPIHPPRAEC